MIDLHNETTISLSQAARLLPPGRRGRPVTLSCVLRWVLDGVRLASGERVRLEATRMGGRWLTSVEALQRFADRQTPRFDSGPQPGLPAPRRPTPRTPTQRRRALERAHEALDKAGI
jgi:hypothetical protein